MIGFLEELKQQHNDDASIRAFNEIENHLRDKKYGLVWEEHSEEVDNLLKENIPVLTADPERRLCKDESLPWNFIIEGDNLQALYLLEKTHKGKVDCIYIDPPYNTGARDWKYNNDYVDGNDAYRHSKWLSMMRTRLAIAGTLLNPNSSVLIVTIDEKEYLHLGCLLEELFPTARMQMISTLTNSRGVARESGFARVDEYIYVLQFGNSSVNRLPLSDEWRVNVKEDKRVTHLRWSMLIRSGSHFLREDSINQFYPIFVYKNGKKIHSVGESYYGTDRSEVVAPEGAFAVWPLRKDGEEGNWQISNVNLRMLIDKGYVMLGKLSKGSVPIYYLKKGEIKKVENGTYEISGHREDGSIISDTEARSLVTGTQWRIASHDASIGGTNLLKSIFGTSPFSYPKSIYAVYDVLRFFISNKPNACVLDFFSGSGTTGHAVNLLNAEDGGNRRFIMVTNNELSEAEAKTLRKKGFKPGDSEWESKGIAQQVTWPRIYCSACGVDTKGRKLKGNYGVLQEAFIKNDDAKARGGFKRGKKQAYPQLEPIILANGFKTNAKYFKCDWTPRKPEDYLLSNMLCLHIKEMIELQNAIEVDNVKNVLLLNKADVKTHILDGEAYDKIERVWVNQNIVLSAQELKLLEAKGYKYIPKEFFGQELREAAE